LKALYGRRKKMPIERRWLKAVEAGEYLGLHQKSVYRACSERRIPFCKVAGIGVRIDKRELDLLLERNGMSPEGYGKSLKEKHGVNKK
jgi:excisionase family DNA binding protein